MITQSDFVAGGTELHDPQHLSDDTTRVLDILIGLIDNVDAPAEECLGEIRSCIAASDKNISMETLRERMRSVEDALVESRTTIRDARKLRSEVSFGYERVHEKGAQGPGRALRMYSRYRHEDGNVRTFVSYPRDLAIHKLPWQLRNQLQRCVIG